MMIPENRTRAIYSMRDIEIMARTVYGEIRGGDWEAMVAVAWAIRNRVEMDLFSDGKPDWWGEGVVKVCQTPGQFSCWNPRDPNLAKLQQVTTDNAAFRQCLAVVAAVLSDLVPTTIGIATHYYAPAGVKDAPAWSRIEKNGRKAELVCARGPHLFFANVP